MSNSAWDGPVVVGGVPLVRPRRPQWPWEQPDHIQRSSDFLREYICEAYLVRVFDAAARYVHGYRRGFNFVREDESTFAVRAGCLTPTSRSWICNFGRTEADFILFFGFKGQENPSLEFCFVLPLTQFRDRSKITILDDGYHIKGYREFWVEEDKLTEMQAVMDAIRNRDSARIERYLPGPSR